MGEGFTEIVARGGLTFFRWFDLLGCGFTRISTGCQADSTVTVSDFSVKGKRRGCTIPLFAGG